MKYNYLSCEYKMRFHSERVMHLNEFGYTYPSHLTLGLVTYCDQFCRGCYAGQYRYNEDIMVTMSYDILKKTLIDASAFGSQYAGHDQYSRESLGLKAITLVGSGEPLLYPRFIELLEFAKKDLNLDIGLFTNGNNLRNNWNRVGIDAANEKHDIRAALLENCRFVRVSLDAATTETHFIQRGVKDQFDQILDNIRQMVAERKGQYPTIGIQFTVDHNNCKEILAVAKLAKSLGVDYLAYKPKYLPWNSKDKFYDKLSFDQVRDDLESALALSDDTFLIQGKSNQFLAAWGKEKYQVEGASSPCTAIWISSYLDVDVLAKDPKNAEPRIFICVNKNKEDKDEQGAPLWASAPIGSKEPFDSFWRREMARLANGVNLNECITGCRNQPYNDIVKNMMDGGRHSLEQGRIPFVEALKYIHPGHV